MVNLYNSVKKSNFAMNIRINNETMKRNLILIVCALCCITTCAKVDKKKQPDNGSTEEKTPTIMNQNYKMKVDTTEDLIMYDITDCQLDLACGSMPTAAQEDVVLCVAAAFTGKCLDSFEHSNILGPHISQGELHKGYDEEGGYAVFASWGKQKGFIALEDKEKLEEVVASKGMAFTQYWVVKDGEGYNPPRQTVKQEYYRCIAQKAGRTYVIESKEVVKFDFFVKCLVEIGIENALYMDMGKGWNHSFYRDQEGKVHILHPKTHEYCTNWLVVKQN
jgi:hypothetical protein